MADPGFYARAADAIRGACALIGEAADATQRAGFFAVLEDWVDEAKAAAHEADQTAMGAAAAARRARREVDVYAEVARRTVAEVLAAYAAASGAETEPVDSLPDPSPDPVPAQDLALMPDQGSDDYTALVEVLPALSSAREAFEDVAEVMIALSDAQDAYRQEMAAGAQTAMAADVQSAREADALAAYVTAIRASLAGLRIARSAYNATVTNDVWDLLAEARSALTAAAGSILEAREAFGADDGAQDHYAAFAFVGILGGREGVSPGAYDVVQDAVTEVTERLLRVKAAYEDVEAALVEVRAVAADALIEARAVASDALLEIRAVVGADALMEARGAYNTASAALDSLVQARLDFEIGFAMAVPAALQGTT